MKFTTAALWAFAFLSPTVGAPQDPMGWTGVLDEASFAALHELKKGKAPELFGEDLQVGETKAYLSLPKAGPSLGGIIVIHEWWGLNDHIKHWTDRLAADGYAALAIDLYGGTIATTRDEAMNAMRAVDEAKALATLSAAHEFLLKDERVKADRTAVIGWCFGGGWSLQLAMAEPELDAAIMYYGRLVNDGEKLASIQAPILGVFGNADAGIPPASVAEFAAAMKKADKSLTLAQFDADHAFANPSSARYDAEHAAAAWLRSREFLATHMMPTSDGLFSKQSRTLEFWTPIDWKTAEPGSMRLASFKVDSGSDGSVIALPGDGGGLEANLNRWLAQMGNDPMGSDEIEELPRVPMLGQLAIMMRTNGRYTSMSGSTIEDATMVGAICSLEEETVYVKLVGPRTEVEAQLDNFAAFCRSLR